MMRCCKRNGCWALAVAAMIILAGCDGRPSVIPTSGQVLINGKPLVIDTSGFVRVEPADGRAAIGEINKADGTFTLTTFEEDDGCMPGTHPVAIIVNVTVGPKLISLIPEKYSDAKTSGLQVTIEKETPLKIELTGELKKAPKPSAADLRGDDPGY